MQHKDLQHIVVETLYEMPICISSDGIPSTIYIVQVVEHEVHSY